MKPKISFFPFLFSLLLALLPFPLVPPIIFESRFGEELLFQLTLQPQQVIRNLQRPSTEGILYTFLTHFFLLSGREAVMAKLRPPEEDRFSPDILLHPSWADGFDIEILFQLFGVFLV